MSSTASSSSSPQLPSANQNVIDTIQKTFFENMGTEKYSSCISLFQNPYYHPWTFRDEHNFTPLHHAIFHNDNLFAEIIISTTKSHTSKQEFIHFINEQSDKGFTALHYASFKGNIHIIQLLLTNNADILIKSYTGLNVMHLAAQGNMPISLYYFSKVHCIDYQCRDYSANTPLHWACYYNNFKTVKFLILAIGDKLNINITNKEKNSPLHLAVVANSSSIIKRLLLKGADPYIENNKHQNAIDIAKEKKYNSIVSLLTNKINRFKQVRFHFYTICLFYFMHVVIPLLIVLFNLSMNNMITYIFIIWSVFINIINIWNRLIDPGFITSSTSNSDNKMTQQQMINEIDFNKFCPACDVECNDDCRHCYICNKCVDGFDHHCVWMGKCVGNRNKQLFYITMMFIMMNCFVIASVVVYSELLLKDNTTIIHNINTNIYRNNIIKHIISFISIIFAVFGIIVVTPLVIFGKEIICNYALSRRNKSNNNSNSSNKTMKAKIKLMEHVLENKTEIEFTEHLV